MGQSYGASLAVREQSDHILPTSSNQREYNTQAGPPASMPSHSDPLPPGGSHSFLKPGTQCENKQA